MAIRRAGALCSHDGQEGSSGGGQGAWAGSGRESEKRGAHIRVRSMWSLLRGMGSGHSLQLQALPSQVGASETVLRTEEKAEAVCVLSPGSREQTLKDGDDWVLVGGHHQHAAELVQEHEQLGAPCVLVVHDLLQVVVAAEVV